MWKQKQYSEQNDKIAFNTLDYITIYHTYWLLYCKRHIQMMSNDSTINVKTKAIKWTKWQDCIQYTRLHYNISHLPIIIMLQKTHSDDE